MMYKFVHQKIEFSNNDNYLTRAMSLPLYAGPLSAIPSTNSEVPLSDKEKQFVEAFKERNETVKRRGYAKDIDSVELLDAAEKLIDDAIRDIASTTVMDSSGGLGSVYDSIMSSLVDSIEIKKGQFSRRFEFTDNGRIDAVVAYGENILRVHPDVVRRAVSKLALEATRTYLAD